MLPAQLIHWVVYSVWKLSLLVPFDIVLRIIHGTTKKVVPRVVDPIVDHDAPNENPYTKGGFRLRRGGRSRIPKVATRICPPPVGGMASTQGAMKRLLSMEAGHSELAGSGIGSLRLFQSSRGCRDRCGHSAGRSHRIGSHSPSTRGMLRAKRGMECAKSVEHITKCERRPEPCRESVDEHGRQM